MVNALSEYLEAGNCGAEKFIIRNTKEESLKQKSQSYRKRKKTGTKVTFYPDGEIFKTLISNETIEERLRSLLT